MAGRSLKYTPERAERVLEAIRKGGVYEHACNYAGISTDTFGRWRDGKQGAPADFAVQVKEAEGQATIHWLTKIEEAANAGNWQAAAWKLERRHPHDYGRTVHEQQQSGELTIRVQYGDRDDSA